MDLQGLLLLGAGSLMSALSVTRTCKELRG